MKIIKVSDRVRKGIVFKELILSLQQYYTRVHGSAVDVLDLDGLIDTLFYNHLSSLGQLEREKLADVRLNYLKFLTDSFGPDYIQILINEAVNERFITGAQVLVVRHDYTYDFQLNHPDKVAISLVPEWFDSDAEGTKIVYENKLFDGLNKAGCYAV